VLIILFSIMQIGALIGYKLDKQGKVNVLLALKSPHVGFTEGDGGLWLWQLYQARLCALRQLRALPPELQALRLTRYTPRSTLSWATLARCLGRSSAWLQLSASRFRACGAPSRRRCCRAILRTWSAALPGCR
jgi:hypothetical protein